MLRKRVVHVFARPNYAEGCALASTNHSVESLPRGARLAESREGGVAPARYFVLSDATPSCRQSARGRRPMLPYRLAPRRRSSPSTSTCAHPGIDRKSTRLNSSHLG